MSVPKVTYADCIVELVPGAEWSITGNDYNSITWDNNAFTKPTLEEIKAKKTELENALPLKMLREERDFLLEQTDKYALPDYPHINDAKKTEWLTYRQNLRDLTKTQTPILNFLGVLENVTWPTKPT
tara:strand:+ start:731 stop:1111 length:381 start_codon:yes stop_codon:yes gene_type:complete